MKKLLCILLSAMMLLCCATAIAESGEPVELTIALWGDEARVAAYLETLAPWCEANNAKVTIELVALSDFQDKLSAQLGNGTAPDVFWLADSNETTFIKGGWCYDMQNELRGDAAWDVDDFYPDAINSTDYDGSGAIYGVPFSFGARAIYYNKTLFEAAGLETPADCVANGTWTYDKMFELAAKIHEFDATKTGLKLWCVGQTGNGLQMFADMLPAYGASMLNADSSEFTLDTPEGIQVVQMVYDSMYVTNGHAKPGDDAAFLSGNIAMARENFSYMKSMVEGSVDFEWDVVPQPYGPAGADGSQFTGYAYWMANATGKHLDLAVDLIKFVTSPENQLAWCTTFTSPRTSVMTSDAIVNKGEGYPSPESLQTAFVDCVAERGLTAVRGTAQFTLLSTTIQQDLEMIWAGQYSVEEGIAIMKEDVAPYLN